MLNDRITNTLAAWLNGDLEHCWMGEQLSIDSAVVDGDGVVLLLTPLEGGVPFRARFALMEIELQTFAVAREKAAKQK
jgi:hypothetical protein